MTTHILCTCGRTFQRHTRGRPKQRCDTCTYRHSLMKQREHRLRHPERYRALSEQWRKANREWFNQLARKSQRRAGEDPVKLAQRRKYMREYKRFFPDRFNIQDEVMVRESEQP